TADSKAHFKIPVGEQPELGTGEFVIVTRRGKQFNSMVHEDKETMNRLERRAILINRDDARQMGFADGDEAQLANTFGVFQGRLAFADIASGTIEVYWPEGNVLIDPNALSPQANIPAYKSGKAALSRPTQAAAQEVKV